MANPDYSGEIEGAARAREEQTKALAGSDLAGELEIEGLQDPKARERIAALARELDLADSQSVLHFGTRAQQKLTDISDRMLEGVRNKDVGPAGESLSELISVLRGFDVDRLDPNRRQGLFDRLLAPLRGGGKPIVRFLQEYEQVGAQVDRITDALERQKTLLLQDVTALDRLYDANLDYFRTLELYIAAGEEKLRELDETAIPALAARAEDTSDMVTAQELRDLRGVRDDLERRVHDLRLTRQVSMQSLPSIRLVQENDKGLINKIGSTLVNTVPLWRQQLAQALTIYRSGEAAETVRAATDLTNELLQANAENLRQANAEARRQIERGVFDIEAVKAANQSLIDTIEESLAIAGEGRRARARATADLRQLESDLRRTLASAGARTDTAAEGERD